MKKTIFMILFALVIGGLMFAAVTNVIDETLGMCAAMSLAVLFSIVVAISAYKNDVKLIVVLMVILMVVEVGILSYNVVSFFVTDKDNTFYLVVERDNSSKTKRFSYEEMNYYTYNVGEVNVHSKGRIYSLETALKEKVLKIDDILSKSIPSKNTIGYEIYYDGGIAGIDKDEFSIVVCNKKDIIFGPYTYNYTDEMCKN